MSLSSEPYLVDCVCREGSHIVCGYGERGDHGGEGFHRTWVWRSEVNIVLFVSVEDEREILGEGGSDQVCVACVCVMCRVSGWRASGEVGDVIVITADDDALAAFAWCGGGLFVGARCGHGCWLSWVVSVRVGGRAG